MLKIISLCGYNMGLLSKIKNLFFKQKEGKIFLMPKYWSQEELKEYFGYGLDL